MRSDHRARAFAAENGLDATVALFEGYSQLLDDATVDAVYIPLPTTLHLEWATKAAQRGKHILLEKPVATHAAEFLEIYRACELHGVLLMDGTMFMHNERLGALINQLRRHALDSVRISRLESAFSFHGNKAFLQSNIRVDQTADPLGALGDLGKGSVPLHTCAPGDQRLIVDRMVLHPSRCLGLLEQSSMR